MIESVIRVGVQGTELRIGRLKAVHSVRSCLAFLCRQ